ncbi:MAG: metal-sensitive transcriptional regulator [Spirochaetes bacterium]|nr:metal-sensitive transcriptional regulator [Spirochaetota bacterium]
MRIDQIETELSIEAEEKRGPHPVNQQVSRRLKNIEGQVRGIQRMVDEEQYCVDILTQISAVRAALNSVGMLILRRHIDTCVTNAIKAGGEGRVQIIDELMSMLSKARL